MNHTHSKVFEWFKNEYPDAIKYMKTLSTTQIQQLWPPCTEGKATRAFFKQKHQNRYALLEEVSLDTTGPITPAYIEGNRFIQILVDACLGWTDEKIMRNKREAGKAIMTPLAKLQRTRGVKAKILQTDGASEKNTKEFQNFLDFNGTEATYAAPGSSQSNAFAEGQFRYFMEAALTAMSAALYMPKTMLSYAVLDAADKESYMANANGNVLQAKPHSHIKDKVHEANVDNTNTLLPWSKKGKIVR